MLDVELINSFLGGAQSVLGHFNIKAVLEKKLMVAGIPQIKGDKYMAAMLGVLGIGEHGEKGSVVFAANVPCVQFLVSAMMGGMLPPGTADDLLASALSELGNMIAGNAMITLSSKKRENNVDITPPVVLSGENLQFFSGQKLSNSISLPLNVGGGVFWCLVGVE